jgi:uncharacterized membrane protein
MNERGHEFWMDGVRHTHDAWWYGPGHVVVALLIAAFLVLGLVWLLRRLPSRDAGGAPAVAPEVVDPAVAELRMRYARGEVDRDTYVRSIADLTGRPAGWPGEATADAPTAPPPALET